MRVSEQTILLASDGSTQARSANAWLSYFHFYVAEVAIAPGTKITFHMLSRTAPRGMAEQRKVTAQIGGG